MAPFAWFVPFLLAASSKTDVSFQVCLSPGCIADGAHQTLAKLQALAPPGVEIGKGTCESLCGKGPIVTQPVGYKNKVIHRRISGDALLDLLSNSIEYEMDPALVQGYELVAQAQECFLKKEYEKAISLYKEGIGMALDPAERLVQSEEQQEGGGLPPRLEWLVRAYCEQAEAHLAVKGVTDALVAAQEACDLSNNADALSLETLAQVCQVSNNAQGELKALQSLFALPDDPKMSLDVANRRRTLGFRLAKLERELNAAGSST